MLNAIRHVYWAIRYGEWDCAWYAECDWVWVCEYYDGNIFGVRICRLGISVMY